MAVTVNGVSKGKRVKVVIFGPHDAGKSTFIHTIDPQSRHIDVETTYGSTTIALDFGRTVIHGIQVYLFGTPGQERFEFVRTILSTGMQGALVILDSTTPPDSSTISAIQRIRAAHVPLGFLINKCDCPHSFPNGWHKELGDEWIRDISALDRSGSEQALAAYIDFCTPR